MRLENLQICLDLILDLGLGRRQSGSGSSAAALWRGHGWTVYEGLGFGLWWGVEVTGEGKWK